MTLKIEPALDDSLRETLVATVKEKGYCFYADLFAKFGIDPESFEEKTSLHAALTRINDGEIAEGRPLLSAVVVEKTTMIPTKNFFDQARMMGRYDGPLTGDKAQRFHDQEMKRIGEFWKSRQIGDVFSKTAAADRKTMPKVSAPRSTEELVLKWEETSNSGGEDHFSLTEFGTPCTAEPREHRVVSPKGKSSTAKYALTVMGRTASLDYDAFKPENKAKEIPLGTLRLTFKDDDRLAVSSATWTPAGGKELPVRLKQSSFLPASIVPYGPTDESGEPTDGNAAETEFRRRLRVAYGDRCCITGCDVVEALDIAHLDRFKNASHNHPGNGLLLRKDLRALLDAGLIAIDPISRTVYLASRTRSYPEYNGLDGRKLREPSHGFAAYAPDTQALTRKWKAFQARA